jgi:hypothetical protein
MRVIWLRLGIVLALATGTGIAHAQTLLDRVMARVDGQTILLSDVRAASGLGVADADQARAIEQLIERRLMLAEVARFPPPEPTAAAVEAETARLHAAAGTGLAALITASGLTEEGVTVLARDTLRIQAYQEQRFGAGAAVSDEQARQYYDDHRDAFTRDGRVRPFDEVADDARREAGADRRRLIVEQWVRDLRSRAEVVVVPERPR